jgi:hypothetical protein
LVDATQRGGWRPARRWALAAKADVSDAGAVRELFDAA